MAGGRTAGRSWRCTPTRHATTPCASGGADRPAARAAAVGRVRPRSGAERRWPGRNSRRATARVKREMKELKNELRRRERELRGMADDRPQRRASGAVRGRPPRRDQQAPPGRRPSWRADGDGGRPWGARPSAPLEQELEHERRRYAELAEARRTEGDARQVRRMALEAGVRPLGPRRAGGGDIAQPRRPGGERGGRGLRGHPGGCFDLRGLGHLLVRVRGAGSTSTSRRWRWTRLAVATIPATVCSVRGRPAPRLPGSPRPRSRPPGASPALDRHVHRRGRYAIATTAPSG